MYVSAVSKFKNSNLNLGGGIFRFLLDKVTSIRPTTNVRLAHTGEY